MGIPKGRNSMLTCSLYKAISLFIKNFECLPDLVFNLWILEFPEMAILPTERGSWFYSYLVINQTNSLKLMSPSPSWSMTETISWNKLGQRQFKIWRGRGWGTLSSSSFGSHPKVLITLPSSSSPILPPPSLQEHQSLHIQFRTEQRVVVKNINFAA